MKVMQERTTGEWLALAARWRLASLLFQLPSRDSHEELLKLMGEMCPSDNAQLRECAAIPFEEWETEYHGVLGPGGIPACESSYDDNALAGRGPLLAQIAGFYEAFSYRPDARTPEVPDHISVEFGFLSYLAVKIAFAQHEDRDEERSIAAEAYERFLEEHPLYWLDRFRERLEQSGSSFYRTACTRLPIA